MRSTDLWRRAAGVADYIGQGAPGRHFGRWLCLNCPRDHHEPPFLPFGLPIHSREHRRRFPRHVIAFWCWDHLCVEEAGATGWRWGRDGATAPPFPMFPNGGSTVTQPLTLVAAAIGACDTCKMIFYVGPDSPNCLGCGRPPDSTIPLQGPGGVGAPSFDPTPDAPTPPAEAPTIYIACPDCERVLAVTIGEDAIGVRAAFPAEIPGEMVDADEPDAVTPLADGPAADDGEPEASPPSPPAPPPADDDGDGEGPQEEEPGE